MTADSYFSVAVRRDRLSRGKVVILAAAQFLLLLLPIPTVNDIEPKRRCDVEVRRKTDGRLMATYAFRKESEALERLASLREHLTQTTPAEFLKELGFESEPR